MSDADPARPSAPSLGEPKRGAGELALRVVSALLMAPVAVGIAYVGDGLFAAFWGAAALVVLWEWTSLVSKDDRRGVLLAGGAAIVVAVALAAFGSSMSEGAHGVRLFGALTALALGMLAAAALAPRRPRMWIAGGVPYAGLLGLAPVVLRSEAEYGFLAVVFLFAVVWATDILAYFTGRALGGPKLAPHISPKKTWSGAIGGIVAAAAAAIAIAWAAGLGRMPALAVLAVVLSCLAQAGDLFESALKRRFGAKDASHLIPGHGGLMDRLDGFVAAALAAALIGIARGGLDGPARGLLVW